ncbi:hypothetical protein PPL_01603 [Heterostelium album PN500]|uniref:O-methyltransferase n=1 Tax=Heterostelium pallidum (strain ATCC 26659 / Pp 5 / PN500) TaxID=670386 RepID=D3AZY9_HETP5|nr:hypothetical protein PPL_01603 [Heterostelium album PN500]EFA84613.1 hypothetical protein PPL_01603 [Heterostelium album PN500]|eukprot:XP_020436726.1 hypothetical protein PPL_01603 [Heterostelium album PN500]
MATPPPQGLSPEAKLMQVATGYWASQCLAAVIRLDIQDCFKNGPRSIYDIAQEKNCNGDALYRSMRALSNMGIFMECEEDGYFDHSPTTKILENPNGYINALKFETHPSGYKCWSNYFETVKNGGPNAHENFNAKNMWDVIHQDKEFNALFSRAMGTFTKMTTFAILKEVGHEFAKYETVCDVGGSKGVLMNELLKINPNIQKGICFDLPSVVADTKSEDSRFSVVGGSFFDSVPEADCYTIKNVLHDWSDEKCIDILRTIGKSMKQGGKIYIFDSIIKTKNTPSLPSLLDVRK